jgi:hypothetical protein
MVFSKKITMWGKLQGAFGFDRLSKVNQTGEDVAPYKPKKFNYSRPEFLIFNRTKDLSKSTR